MGNRWQLGLCVLVAGLFGCGKSAPPLCTPGEQKSCSCPGGALGVQVCNAEGTALGACTGCTVPEDGGNDAGFDGGTDGGTDAGTDAGFPQPPGTVAVSFGVDDSANQVFASGELLWKGTMKYDAANRTVEFDTNWTGPWAPLFDDGPWNATGHEPLGATAGDHKWGVTVFIAPTSADQSFQYGLVDHSLADGWLWQGSNGVFVVPAGATAPITATGMTFAPFGTTDLQVVLDATNLDPVRTWNTSSVELKGTFVGWYPQGVSVVQNVATYTQSEHVAPGQAGHHFGLLRAGDHPEFVWVLGGMEYRGPTAAYDAGVSAFVKAADAGQWTQVPVVHSANGNTSVVIP